MGETAANVALAVALGVVALGVVATAMIAGGRAAARRSNPGPAPLDAWEAYRRQFRPDPMVCPHCHHLTFDGLLILLGHPAACRTCVETDPVLGAAREPIDAMLEREAATLEARRILREPVSPAPVEGDE